MRSEEYFLKIKNHRNSSSGNKTEQSGVLLFNVGSEEGREDVIHQVLISVFTVFAPESFLRSIGKVVLYP